MSKTVIAALRSCVFYVAVTVLSIIWCPLLYLMWPLPFAVRRDFFRVWSYCVTWCGKWLCGMRYRFHGLEQLGDVPVIFFSKHQSAWETLVFPGKLPRNCFVCKQSLLNIPIFGWGMRLGKHIPIDREESVKAFKQVIKQGRERLNEDKLSIVIFPEGTRVAPGEHPEFHKSGAALARATGYPIVPIAHNSGKCWQRNRFIKFPGTIDVIIGPRVDTKGHSVDDINHHCHDWIKTQMQKLENA